VRRPVNPWERGGKRGNDKPWNLSRKTKERGKIEFQDWKAMSVIREKRPKLRINPGKSSLKKLTGKREKKAGPY